MPKNSPRLSATGPLAAAIVLLAGCSGTDGSAGAMPDGALALLPEHPGSAAGCGPDGRLTAELYGVFEGRIDWTGDELACEGMPRPADRGARLRFAGTAAGVELAFLLSLPDYEPGRVAAELPTNVTVIEEGDGRFFSTTDLDRCWTDLEKNERVGDDGARYRVGGTLYCIAPLAEVNGDASITIETLAFTGYLARSAE